MTDRKRLWLLLLGGAATAALVYGAAFCDPLHPALAVFCYVCAILPMVLS